MSYRIEPDESLARGVRRVAREQAERALTSLGEAEDEPGPAIHDARKRFKKIRAVLRLVRLHVGEEVFDRENVAWRDAGRLLSDAREADVAPETLELLETSFDPVLAGDAFDALREQLRDRGNAVLEDALHPGGPVDEVVERVREARDRIALWPVAELDPGAVAAGFEKVYGRGRARLDDAYDDPSDPPAAFHEWRKRAKYLWYHLRLLAPAWPEILEPRAEEQHGLTNLLGDANDLSDLLALLAEDGEALVPDAAVREAVAGLARRQRTRWWDESRPLGRLLYALPARDAARRVRTVLEEGALAVAPAGSM
jgi:CHAD domain-containing protein